MLKELVGTYQMIKGTEYLFTPPREVVGKCPRCGGEVVQSCKRASSARHEGLQIRHLEKQQVVGRRSTSSPPKPWWRRCSKMAALQG